MRFIKVNELKLTQVELFSFFHHHFKCVTADVSELFCMAHLGKNVLFLYHPKLSFKYQILYLCKLASLS